MFKKVGTRSQQKHKHMKEKSYNTKINMKWSKENQKCYKSNQRNKDHWGRVIIKRSLITKD